MFYIKENIKDGINLEVELTGEAITYCPVCQKEIEVDLISLIRSDKDFDFYGTSFFCKECSIKYHAPKI